VLAYQFVESVASNRLSSVEQEVSHGDHILLSDGMATRSGKLSQGALHFFLNAGFENLNRNALSL
jgi:hypothetical protein